VIVINVYFPFLLFLSLFSLAYLNKSVSSLNFLLLTTYHVTMKVWLAVGGWVIHLDWCFPWTVLFAEFHIYHLIFGVCRCLPFYMEQ